MSPATERVSGATAPMNAGVASQCRRSASRLLLAAMLVVPGLCLVQCGTTSVESELRRDAVLDTDLTAQDYETAIQNLARKLAECGPIAQRAAPAKIAFIRMENATIDDGFDSADMLNTVAECLIRGSSNRFTFVDLAHVGSVLAERAAFDPDALASNALVAGVDYFLTGRAFSHSLRKGGKREVYYRISLRLTDVQTSEIVWEKDWETKKKGEYEIMNR